MSSDSPAAVAWALAWGPGLIGLTIGAILSGVAIGQVIFYAWAFPQDMAQLKAVVFLVSTLDFAQTIALTWLYHHFLIYCRHNVSSGCVTYAPAPMILIASIAFCVTFIVQCFYAHRVWIISGQNLVITSAVLIAALAQLLFGFLCVAKLLFAPVVTFELISTNKFSAWASIASAICDALITTSIVCYLRAAGAGLRRRGNYMKKLNMVFIQMGLLSFINALALVILYYVQDRSHGVLQFLSAAPGIVISKVYTNSMLSVLNARKAIREQQAQGQSSVDLPSIRTS